MIISLSYYITKEEEKEEKYIFNEEMSALNFVNKSLKKHL